MNRRRAFTLVEVIVASILVAMIAGATTIVLSRAIKSRDTAIAKEEAFGRAQAAASVIARDIRSAARDGDLRSALVRLVPGGGAEAATARDELILVSITGRPIRPTPENPEGPAHEVQYRVVEGVQTDEAPSLWRREDPYADDYPDAGGIATPVVPGIKGLKLEVYDGQTWTNEWDSDSLGYPMAVRLTVTATSTVGSISESRTARQVIALDRTPPPVMLALAPAPAAATGGNTTTPTGGGGGGGGGGASTMVTIVFCSCSFSAGGATAGISSNRNAATCSAMTKAIPMMRDQFKPGCSSSRYLLLMTSCSAMRQ